jgi:hypothetical protein
LLQDSPVGKRQRKRRRDEPAATTDYRDAEGNVLTLRDSLSAGTIEKLKEPVGVAASSADDMWRRRTEMLFERFAVSWTIAGLPLTSQKELLGRYRLADAETQRWVRETLADHLRSHHPELEP